MAFALPADDTPKSYRQILTQQIDVGLEELERPVSGLTLSALSAGLDIGFGPFLVVVTLTLMSGSLPEPVTELLMAFMYSLGFLFVILGRSELFTEHTTLAVLPVLDRRASPGSLARLWSVVFVGNVVGGALFAAFAVYVGTSLGVASVESFTEIATKLVEHETSTILAGGVLAGWLMGLLSWLIAAARDTTSRVVVILIVTSAIGFAHLPHCIAGNVEVLMGMFVSSEIGLVDYLRFLGAATAGNLIGGSIFVALLKYGHVTRSENGHPAEESVERTYD